MLDVTGTKLRHIDNEIIKLDEIDKCKLYGIWLTIMIEENFNNIHIW